MDIKNLGKGAIPIPLTIKDYRLELLPTTAKLPEVFSLKDKIGEVKSQGSSGSCVAQSFSYYAEVLNKIETGQYEGLSARDIYSLIFVEPMGAWLKDGASKICKSGVIPEKDAVSYENGNPPSEQFMRRRDNITQSTVNKGYTYLAGKYVTWDNTSIEKYKQAILQCSGCVSAFGGNNYCWQNAEILVPEYNSQIDWWHAVYLCGFFTISDADDELVKKGLMTMKEARRRYDEGISR
jgi:C1A family cysteine protease